jgi:LacI family transcriptional regulator
MATPPGSERSVSLQQVADSAGVSLACASYALRRSRKIPEATRKRVLAAAERLRYRPNPRFAALMAHIRRAHPIAAKESIAFVWVHTPRSESATDPFLQRVYRGARERAEALGYRLEQFWTNEPGMTDRRLSAVIKARGIVGVVFSPVMHEAEVTLDFEWDAFAPAVIGSARWNPELHHAGHHHYLAMRLVLDKLAEAGCRRPLAIIDAETNERARRAMQAAFLVYHPEPAEAAALLLVGLPPDRPTLVRRLRESRTDALIVSGENIIDQMNALGVSPPEGAPVVGLNCLRAKTIIGGIDDRFDLVAANAVDLVVSQLNGGETGVPAIPRMLLFPGGWIEPAKSRAEPAARRAAGARRPVC